MWKPKLNPVTQKRLKRFVAFRRSYWSFWILVGLYAVSLLADLISNDRPLYVSFEGNSYFPIFQFYPDDVFTGSGLSTRPDYKEVAATEAFRAGEGNYMVFTPIPFGPYETLGASSISVSEDVHITIERIQKVGSLTVDKELEVSRSTAAFAPLGFGSDRELRGLDLSSVVEVSDELRRAILGRFSNAAAMTRLETVVNSANGVPVALSLSEYEPRSREPRTVRVTFREVVENFKGVDLLFGENGNLDTNGFWKGLGPEEKALLRASAQKRLEGPMEPLEFQSAGSNYRATLEKEDVYFPFRPTGNHYFGLDSSGRDVLSRILYGLRISLNFGLALVGITMLLGIVIGGYQGYKGGVVDLAGQRFIEIWESLPFLYIMILMGSLFGRSFGLLLTIYGIFNWVGISYYVRGEFLKLRKQPFVEAAHCLGLSPARIMTQHIFPNALVPVITLFPFALVGAIFSLSALDYLGFGLPPPTPSWGEMLSQAQEFKHAWWLVLYPSLSLFVVVLLGVFVGEGIRAAFDPRVNSRFES